MQFDKEHRSSGKHGADSALHRPLGVGTSGGLSEVLVLIGSAAVVTLIFVLDLLTGADIRLHVLYVFPLAIVARYCARLSVAIAALLLTTILQVITFSTASRGDTVLCYRRLRSSCRIFTDYFPGENVTERVFGGR
jgi:hypothetical protein